MRTRRILIIDDAEANRYVLRKILGRVPQYAIVEAANGREGLALIEESIDLVILDVNLPDMMGFELIRRAQEKLGGEKLPAIVNISATFVSSSDKAHGLNKGARAYLTHPLNPDEVLATIGSLLKSDLQLRHVRQQQQIAQTRSERLAHEKIMLERFMRSFSHDLRSPLSAAHMSAEIMRQYPSMRTDEVLGVLQANLKRIAEMITNLLDISHASMGGEIGLVAEAIPLVSTLKEAIANLQLQIANPIVLNLIEVPAEQCVQWDKLAFLRILDNLIINAAKHGTAATVIDVKAAVDEDTVVLRLANDGAFPDDVLANLATPYFISTRSDTQGWGLGLPIVKALCESFQGSVTFENSDTKALVTVRLPLQCAGSDKICSAVDAVVH